MSTYRVRGVPADWDDERLQSFLNDQETVTDAVIQSLAHDSNGICQVAFLLILYFFFYPLSRHCHIIFSLHFLVIQLFISLSVPNQSLLRSSFSSLLNEAPPLPLFYFETSFKTALFRLPRHPLPSSPCRDPVPLFLSPVSFFGLSLSQHRRVPAIGLPPKAVLSHDNRLGRREGPLG